jgi:hypothetical protein
MGIQRENGYSASISAYLTVGTERFQIAKMNRDYLTLAEPCELAPNTEGQITVVVDEKKSTQMIALSDGVTSNHRGARYSVLAPF